VHITADGIGGEAPSIALCRVTRVVARHVSQLSVLMMLMLRNEWKAVSYSKYR
jgi:hypothetical protein